MNVDEIFRVWAPENVIWSRWAKPVAFAQGMGASPFIHPGIEWQNLDVPWTPVPAERTAIVVDLPGAHSVLMGVALANKGYRPVPLYNACRGMNAVVDVVRIIDSLFEVVEALRSMPIPFDAPPAFLLDADRMARNAIRVPGDFDNRSMMFPQDFPSSNFLLSERIERVLLVQLGRSQPQEDLAHVLLRWQNGGIKLLRVDPSVSGQLEPLQVVQPPQFRSMWHRALALIGLRRNSAGGFGSLIPEPSQSSGFG